VFAFTREADGERLLVALNFTDTIQRVGLGSGSARVRLSTRHDRDGTAVDLTRVELSRDEGVVLASS
jgi:hypothetical protein